MEEKALEPRAKAKPPPVLFYPNYAPERRELRQLLMLYDSIRTIVPQIDQADVWNRQHLGELHRGCENSSELVGFIDPESYVDWATRDGISKVADGLVKQVEPVPEALADHIRRIRRDAAVQSNVRIKEEDVALFRTHGWIAVSRQRVNSELLDTLCERGLGIRVVSWPDPSGQFVTAHPLVVHRTVARFIRSRLAREVASREFVPALSIEDEDIANFTFDPSLKRPELRTTLAAISMPVLLPDDLETMDIKRYFDLRNEFSVVRERLNAGLQKVLVAQNLDDAPNGRILLDRATELQETVSEEIRDVVKRVGDRAFTKQCMHGVTFFATLIAGALTDGIAGAMTGYSVALLGEKYVNRYSTVEKQGGLFENLVALRAEVEAGKRSQKFRIPTYHV